MSCNREWRPSVGVEVQHYPFLPLVIDWDGWTMPYPCYSTLRYGTQYSLHRRVGGPQGHSGRVRNILFPPGFKLQTAQPIESQYTNCAIPAWANTVNRSQYSFSTLGHINPTTHRISCTNHTLICWLALKCACITFLFFIVLVFALFCLLIFQSYLIITTFSVSSFARYTNFPMAGSSSSGSLDRWGPASCFTVKQSGNLLQSSSSCDSQIVTNPFKNCQKKSSSFWITVNTNIKN